MALGIWGYALVDKVFQHIHEKLLDWLKVRTDIHRLQGMIPNVSSNATTS